MQQPTGSGQSDHSGSGDSGTDAVQQSLSRRRSSSSGMAVSSPLRAVGEAASMQMVAVADYDGADYGHPEHLLFQKGDTIRGAFDCCLALFVRFELISMSSVTGRSSQPGLLVGVCHGRRGCFPARHAALVADIPDGARTCASQSTLVC